MLVSFYHYGAARAAIGAFLIFLLLSPALLLKAQQSSVSDHARLTITLQDALARANKYAPQFQSANIAALLAKEDRTQAKAATLPSISGINQFIYTEGNGTPSGVFVANDGVHVYNEQLNAHEELLAFVRRGEVRAAVAAEAVARAKADVAARGLKSTVIQDYYALAAAERKGSNAQGSFDEAQRFLEITQQQEHGGEAAHADVIKAQLQLSQRKRDREDAKLAAQKAKIALAVLMFPRLDLNYDIVDDLSEIPTLPAQDEVNKQAGVSNPDVRVAQASLTAAKEGVSVARYAYLPSFALDVWYGIDANQFLARTNYSTQATGRSTLPDYQVPYRQNLGYVAQASLNIPLWNWGSIHSKVKQAELREQQAQLDLTLTRKQLQADLATAESEAQTALSQVASLRDESHLAEENLRLTILRYQAGEATALEVVDAQTTASQSRNAYDDGLLRYRMAVTSVDTLVGTF